MNTITKNCILEHLKGEARFSDGESKKLLGAFFEELAIQVESGNNVKFYGFGSFTASKPSKRKIQNIKTGVLEEVIIPSKIKFKRNKKKLEKYFL